MTEEELKQRLLVKTVLESVLAKSPDRFDLGGREQRLKAATLLECADKGYVDLTIADIARRSKVSTATIYAAYGDRETLLVAAIELLLSILAEDVIEAPPIEDPLQRVQILLMAHGLVYAQPFATWLFRLYISLTWFENASLRETGARVFHRIDSFWKALLSDLIANGHLAPVDLDIVVPILLGPVERWTILSRLSCGEQDRDDAALADVARHSAESLFAVWGADAFWAARAAARPVVARYAPSQKPPSPLVRPAGPTLAERQAASMDAPAAATVEQRRERILLAAALECEERGYNNASVAEIAARAGVSVATLYKYFADKAGLYLHAVTAETDAIVFGETHSHPPTAAVVASALLAHARAAIAPERAWLLNAAMASELSAHPAIAANSRALRARIEAAWAQGLRLADGGGETTLAVNFLLGGVERASVFARLLFGHASIDEAHLAAIAQTTADAAQCLFGPPALR